MFPVLEFLEYFNLIHSDIKPENILLNFDVKKPFDFYR